MLKPLLFVTGGCVALLLWQLGAQPDRTATRQPQSPEAARATLAVAAPAMAGAASVRPPKRLPALATGPESAGHELGPQDSSESTGAVLDRLIDAGRANRGAGQQLHDALATQVAEAQLGDEAIISKVDCSHDLCRVSVSYADPNRATELIYELLSLQPLRTDVFATHVDLDGGQQLYLAHAGGSLDTYLGP